MKALQLFFAAIFFLLAGILPSAGEAPEKDFSFTTRDGRETSLHEELSRLQPDAKVWLLLFDPDCGECRQLEEQLKNRKEITSGLADKTTAVIAVYPSDGVPAPDDPNLASYRRACGELPEEWIVGIDNGSLFETDAVTWETLPLLLEFRADEIAGSGHCQAGKMLIPCRDGGPQANPDGKIIEQTQ